MVLTHKALSVALISSFFFATPASTADIGQYDVQLVFAIMGDGTTRAEAPIEKTVAFVLNTGNGSVKACSFYKRDKCSGWTGARNNSFTIGRYKIISEKYLIALETGVFQLRPGVHILDTKTTKVHAVTINSITLRGGQPTGIKVESLPSLMP